MTNYCKQNPSTLKADCAERDYVLYLNFFLFLVHRDTVGWDLSEGATGCFISHNRQSLPSKTITGE